MNVCSITYGTVVLLIIQLFTAGAFPMSVYEKRKYPHQIEAQGLYDANDKVTILTKAIFNENVFNQEFGSMVEFYNAFCGFCKRYAPKWKEFAADVHAWQGIVQVAAVDCSVDDNNDLCRTFEVMAYPTVRYFAPHYEDLPKRFGVNTVGHDDVQSLRKQAVEFVRNETNPPSHWPNVKAVIDTQAHTLFSQLPDTVEFVFLIYSQGNATEATEVILDLHSIKRISIRHVKSAEIAANYGMLGPFGLAVINRNLEIVQLHMKDINRAEIRDAISQFVTRRGLSAPVVTTSRRNNVEDMDSYSPSVISERNEQTVSHVKQYEPSVYQADLELALRYTLFHEIPKFTEIRGERLLALQRYINVVNR